MIWRRTIFAPDRRTFWRLTGESDEKARREFEDVAYYSEAASAESSGVTLMFYDELRKHGQTHTFRCSQIVYFGDDETIERIELREIAGERDRLNYFRQLTGAPVNRET